MALINIFKRTTKERTSVHKPIFCLWTSFKGPSGESFLQLDTCGSTERKIPGKTSQSIQLDKKSAKELKKIINKVFPELK